MRTSKTFSIRFWVNPKKARNNSALLYARVTVNQQRIEISLKRKVSLDLGDSKNKKVLGNSSEAKQINQYLEETRVLLFKIFQDLKFKGELITAKKIRFKYLGEDESSRTLLELMEYHSKKIENTHSVGSIRNYGVTEDYIKKFLLKDRKTNNILLK